MATGQLEGDEPGVRGIPAEPGSVRASREIYESLASATPSDRTEILIRLIENHPQGRLELPAQDGLHAVLDEIDLGPETIQNLGQRLAGSPWWDPERNVFSLRKLICVAPV